MESVFAQLSNAMPSGFFPKARVAKIEEELRCASIELGAREYLAACFFIPLLLLPLFFICIALLSKDATFSLAISLLLFACAYLLLVRTPSFLARKKAQEEEADLPLSLGALSIYIDLKIPFEKCLGAIAQERYALSRHLRGVLSSVKLGESVPSALFARAAYTRSSYCRRALASLALCYEGQGSSEGLRRLAEEAGAVANARTREFASKMSFLALLFIAVGALAPAFFAIFLLIAGRFLSLSVSASQVWLAYALAFPLLCACVLGAIYASAPAAIKIGAGAAEGAFSMELFGRKFGKGEGIALFIVCMLPLLCVLFFYPQVYAILLCALLAALPFYAYFAPIYRQWKENEEMERALPDALFHASSMLKGSSMEKIIGALAEGNYGKLSERFSHAKRQVHGGASVSEALREVQLGSDSVLLQRFCSLLLQAYNTGADMKSALRCAASDMLDNFALVRERAGALSMQKYTLFFACALIVPLLLGSVLKMSLALSGGGMLENNIFGGAQNSNISDAIVPALHVYLALFALLCSALFGLFEGRGARAVLYFALLLPLSQMVFVLAYSVNLLGAVA